MDDDATIRTLVSEALSEAGYAVVTASSGVEALELLAEAPPNLVISDITMPDLDGLELVQRMRADENTRGVPLIFLTSLDQRTDVVRGLAFGADDYLTKPFDVNELVARARAKLERPSVASDLLHHDIPSGLLTKKTLTNELQRELGRKGSARPTSAAYIYVYELARIREILGSRAEAALVRHLTAVVAKDLGRLDLVGRDEGSLFLLIMPETAAREAEERLLEVSRAVASTEFLVGEERLRLTPLIGFATTTGDSSAEELQKQAWTAVHSASNDLNLRPIAYQPAMSAPSIDEEVSGPRRKKGGARLAAQIAITLLVGLVAPYFAYFLLDRAGYDVTPYVYTAVVTALVVTSAAIWLEGFYALRRIDPPPARDTWPRATAIVAAYLPNEAATILETVKAFLALDYPGELEIIVAYNTPHPLPVEEELKAIAARDRRLVPFPVPGSNSKAQNVNAAMSEARGELVGVFDADHLPRSDTFRRAWQWLSNGYDVVQGHCVVRNGDASWVARMTAVEFESIYAVHHPGRARLHGFGIFGGSNGYWRAAALAQTRMHGFMLTEDIDSSIRVLKRGGKIAVDPHLVSRELAPGTLKALWNQRMRWAQGWVQVSLEHLWDALRSPHLTLRQKLGFLFLLGWREVYPWISLQMFPIIAFRVWKYRGVDELDWLVPIFVLTTLFTLSVGPGQAVFSYLLAEPEIKKHKSWFWFYLIVGSIFYTEFKNVIARVAQVKEAMGERDWRVTPRSADADADAETS